MTLAATGMLAAAGLTALVGLELRQAGLGAQAFRALCIGLVVAAVASAGIAVVQVYLPSWVDGSWITPSSEAGRAIGNLRQPNHLCTLLLWGIVAAVWLGEARVLRRTVADAVSVFLVFGVVLSASRFGLLAVFMLAAWGILDRRLSKRTRMVLLLAPVVYGILWVGAAVWARHVNEVFLAEAKFGSASSTFGSRVGAWTNSLSLIQAHPWAGVGWGGFNFAWSLTEFPVRTGEFFDNAHNLFLQFAVELGIPLAALVIGLLVLALGQAFKNSAHLRKDGEPSPDLRAAFVMLVLLLAHSQLEYPLWYAYFLLPCAFTMGLCLGMGELQAGKGALNGPAAKPESTLRPIALILMMGAALSVYDYFRVVVIFAIPNNPAPLEQRIADGQKSWFYAHHAHYAQAMVSKDPVVEMASAQLAAHFMLDTRLMMAWADAFHTTGDTERAQYLAQRLREFHNPVSEPYFALCNDPALSEAQKPYQCSPPTRGFSYRDFR